jgi:hypothetical protein
MRLYRDKSLDDHIFDSLLSCIEVKTHPLKLIL